MRPIRVLVVDDAAVVRRLLVDALSADPDITVVGAASNGRQALAQIGPLRPDLVVLDLEMPEMDGLTMLRELRHDRPRLPVVVYSSNTVRGVSTTLDALWMGANDYVTKPRAASAAHAIEIVRRELLPRIKALCAERADAPPAGGEAPRAPGARAPEPLGPVVPRGERAWASRTRRVGVIALAASTGGPRALSTLLGGLPRDFAVPILIVQHIPPEFTPSLAQRLAAQSGLRVAEARSGAPLLPGEVRIAPGDRHLAVEQDGVEVRVRVHDGPAENSCRPSADVLFRSVASVFGAGAMAVVLTGMGHDGRAGCATVRRLHGQVLAQDQGSSVVWGMPGAVVRAGFADAVLPIEALASEIVRRAASAGGRAAA